MVDQRSFTYLTSVLKQLKVKKKRENKMVRIPQAATTNTITVKIAPLMGVIKELILEVDTTVGAALTAAGFSENSEVRVTSVDGTSQTIADNDSVLDNGDVITVIASGKIEAGC